jgi:succinoglycan biosynthesis transport protein ExoP
MLYQDEQPNRNLTETYQSDSESPNISLFDQLKILWKRKWLILFVVITSTTIVTIKSYSEIPLYEANCRLLVDKEKTSVLASQYVSNWDPEYLATQYKILTSKKIVRQTIEKLKTEGLTEFSTENPKLINRFIKMYRLEPIRETRIANIFIRHSNPQTAAIIANAIANTYIESDIERRLSAARYTVNWLSDQLKVMQKKIEEAELSLLQYVEDKNIVSLPTGEISEDQSKMLQHLTNEKVRLETEIPQLKIKYKDKHPKVIQLASDLKNILEKLEMENKNILELRRKQIQYRVLRREVDVNQKLFDALLDKVKEMDLLQGLKSNNISIIDEAEAPMSPVWPNKKKNILLGFFISLTIAIGLALLLEKLDSTFKNDEDVNKWLGMPVLGHVPVSSIIRKKMTPREVALASFHYPKSNFAEAYRYVRTGIAFSAVDKPYPVLLVTSTYPKEGKTTQASNLAIAMASKGENVLLIDADLRKPSLHKVFPSEKDKNVGLSSYLLGDVSEESVVMPTEIPNLWIVRCGLLPPNPSEILESQKMKNFLSWAKSKYKRVIVDSSPLMAVADSIGLATIVDGVVYVIKANDTNHKSVMQCFDRLLEVHAKILGVVLNQITPKGSGYYYQYSYRYKANYYDENHVSSKKRLNEAEKTVPTH